MTTTRIPRPITPDELRIAPLASYLPQPAPQRNPIDVLLSLAVWAAIGFGAAAVLYIVSEPYIFGSPQTAAPARATAMPGGSSTTQQDSAPPIERPIIAQEQPAPPAIREVAPAGVDSLGQAVPTAQVNIATALPIEQVRVVPRAMPVEYAPGSDMRPTPAPTIPYPTPLPAALAIPNVSADGLCVVAERDGKQYQACQGWKYTPAEAASVADYLRTGLVPGEEARP